MSLAFIPFILVVIALGIFAASRGAFGASIEANVRAFLDGFMDRVR